MAGFVLGPTVTFLDINGKDLGKQTVPPGISLACLYTESCIHPEEYDSRRQCVSLVMGNQVIGGLENVRMPSEDCTIMVVNTNKEDYKQALHITPCGNQHVFLWIPFLHNPGTWGPYSLAVLVEKDSYQARCFSGVLSYNEPKNMLNDLITSNTNELLFFIPEGIAKFKVLPNRNENAGYVISSLISERLEYLQGNCEHRPLEFLTATRIENMFNSYQSKNQDVLQIELVRLYQNLAALEAEVQGKEQPS